MSLPVIGNQRPSSSGKKKKKKKYASKKEKTTKKSYLDGIYYNNEGLKDNGKESLNFRRKEKARKKRFERAFLIFLVIIILY